MRPAYETHEKEFALSFQKMHSSWGLWHWANCEIGDDTGKIAFWGQSKFWGRGVWLTLKHFRFEISHSSIADTVSSIFPIGTILVLHLHYYYCQSFHFLSYNLFFQHKVHFTWLLSNVCFWFNCLFNWHPAGWTFAGVSDSHVNMFIVYINSFTY